MLSADGCGGWPTTAPPCSSSTTISTSSSTCATRSRSSTGAGWSPPARPPRYGPIPGCGPSTWAGSRRRRRGTPPAPPTIGRLRPRPGRRRWRWRGCPPVTAPPRWSTRSTSPSGGGRWWPSSASTGRARPRPCSPSPAPSPARGERSASARTAIRPARPHATARQGLACVPQERSLFTQLSVAENLRLAVAGGHRTVAAETARAIERFPALGRARRTAGGAAVGR